MFKEFIEWLEGDVSRGRKVILFLTIMVYLLIILVLFTCGMIWPNVITTGIVQLFGIFSGVVATVYAFYTGTSAHKPGTTYKPYAPDK